MSNCDRVMELAYVKDDNERLRKENGELQREVKRLTDSGLEFRALTHGLMVERDQLKRRIQTLEELLSETKGSNTNGQAQDA